MAFRTGSAGRHSVGAGCRSRHPGGAGFSLVEVIVAIGIFSIAALGIQTLALGLVRTTQSNGHYASAAELAQGELEYLRSLPYDEVATQTSSATVNGVQYSIDSTVSEGADQAETKHIATTVSWVEPGGVSKHFLLQTIYADIHS